jgi:hypothetical protein
MRIWAHFKLISKRFFSDVVHERDSYVVQTFRSAVLAGLKSCTTFNMIEFSRSADLQVCCISRTKVLHYIYGLIRNDVVQTFRSAVSLLGIAKYSAPKGTHYIKT